MMSIRTSYCSLVAASFGVDYRWALMDRRLIQQDLHTPAVWKYGEGYGRYLRRRALAGMVPQEVAWKRSKDGLYPRTTSGLWASCPTGCRTAETESSVGSGPIFGPEPTLDERRASATGQRGRRAGARPASGKTTWTRRRPTCRRPHCAPGPSHADRSSESCPAALRG